MAVCVVCHCVNLLLTVPTVARTMKKKGFDHQHTLSIWRALLCKWTSSLNSFMHIQLKEQTKLTLLMKPSLTFQN